jgi:transglutaminase-like putative cysteine protease
MTMLIPLAITTLLCSPVHAWDLDDPWISLAPPPAWIEPSEPELGTPAPQGMARESAQYLLVDDQVRVGVAQIERYAHTSYRIVTREGLDALSRMEVVFDPAWSKVELHQLRVWRDGAWHDRLEGAHATVIREEVDLWQHIFDGTRKLVVVMSDVRVGDVIDMAWSVDGLDPVFDGHYGEAWPMAWGVPAEQRSLRLLWPAERSLRVQSHGVQPPRLQSLDQGWQEARWDLRHQLAIEEPYDLPGGFDPYPWAEASDFASWAAVVDWALEVYQVPSPADPPVQALADRLWSQTGAPEPFVLAASRWVQDEVRYFGMELGDASHVPHRPTTVLERRYGDCKDKTLLLVSLLRARGIQAWPALVSRDQLGAIAGSLPTPLAFDHVIAVASVEGREVWLDPTERDQGGALADVWIPAFGYALPVRSGAKGLVDVPLPTLPQGRATIRHRYDLASDPDEPGLTVQTRFEGQRAEEMRRVLADISLGRLQDDYLEHYAAMGVAVTPDASIAIRDDRDANAVELSERYRMIAAWQPAGEGLEELWLPPATIFDWLPSVTGPRPYPLALPLGLDEHEQITVLADPDWDLEELDAEVLSPWFEFTASSAPQDGGILLDYRLRVLKDRVEPDELRAYQAALQTMHDASGYSLVRGDVGWAIPWDIIEKVLAFLVAVFAVMVAVPVSVFAAAVLVWLGMPRRHLGTG